MFNLFGDTIHSIRARRLRNAIDDQESQIASLERLMADAKEVQTLQTTYNTNEKRINALLADASGLKI